MKRWPIVVGLLMGNTQALAWDGAYCTLYSREMTRAYIRSIPSQDLPNITTDSLSFRLLNFYTLCINKDEEPLIKDLPSDSNWIADEWSAIQRTLPHPAGSEPAGLKPVPAAVIPGPVKPPLSSPPQHPKKVTAVPSLGQTQAMCNLHRMKTVYSGKSWRCQRT